MTGCETGQSAPMTLSEQRPSLRDIGWRVLRGFALLVIGASIGFGVMSGQDGYDPHMFAIGVPACSRSSARSSPICSSAIAA